MSDNTIYDYDFSVHETEPKRADMLNALKARVKALDKGTIISSTDYNDDSQYDEDRALSAYLLFKLFPTKVHLLKNHYTKEEVDGLLSNLISKYYLKNEIDDMLNALKNELKAKMLADGNDLKQALNALKTELSKHRTQEVIDHPDNSITESKIRDKNISKGKLNDALQAEINGKANKNGDTFTGDVTFDQYVKFKSIRPNGTVEYHTMFGSSGNNPDGRRNFDIGHNVNTYATVLCCRNNPGWYNHLNEYHRLLIDQDRIDLENRIGNIESRFNTNSQNGLRYLWSGSISSRPTEKVNMNRGGRGGSRQLDSYRILDSLPDNWTKMHIYIGVDIQREYHDHDNDDVFTIGNSWNYTVIIKNVTESVVVDGNYFRIINNKLYLTPGRNNNGISIWVE